LKRNYLEADSGKNVHTPEALFRVNRRGLNTFGVCDGRERSIRLKIVSGTGECLKKRNEKVALGGMGGAQRTFLPG